jgi:hypothetical protein
VLDALVIDRFKHPRSMRDLLRFGGKLLMARWIFEKVNTAVRDTIRYGWSMFYPFTREEISPRFMTDPAVDGGDTEFIQTSL